MKYTYDLNTHGCLIITATVAERATVKEIMHEHGVTYSAETLALERLIANSELDWIGPEEIGALTDAPILGLRDKDGEPTNAWAYMDYQVRSFLEDLVEHGKAVFLS